MPESQRTTAFTCHSGQNWPQKKFGLVGTSLVSRDLAGTQWMGLWAENGGVKRKESKCRVSKQGVRMRGLILSSDTC